MPLEVVPQRAEVDRVHVQAAATGRPAQLMAPASSVPSSRWTALWSTPRRSDDTDRVGLNWMVRSRISSKEAKVMGFVDELLRFRPTTSRGSRRA